MSSSGGSGAATAAGPDAEKEAADPPPLKLEHKDVAGYSAAFMSAVFYYLGCSPCRAARHKIKAKKQAKLDMEARKRIIQEQPQRYHHPMPFSTNPYWAEEISMGPSLPKKAGKNQNVSQRKLISAGRDSGMGMSLDGSATADTTTGTTNNSNSGSFDVTANARSIGGPDKSNGPDRPEVNRTSLEEKKLADEEGWNRRRYQREEEELWGSEITKAGRKIMDAIVEAGSSAGRYVEAKLGHVEAKLGLGDEKDVVNGREVTDQDRYNFYMAPRIPPVNDYHPPVLSNRPTHRDGNRWMIQPPPPAKFMEGKIPVGRTTSTTTTTSSSYSLAGRRTLSRGSSFGAWEQQSSLKKEQLPTEDELIEQLIRAGGEWRSPNVSAGRMSLLTRSRSLSFESDDSSEFIRLASSRRWPRAVVARPAGTATATSTTVSSASTANPTMTTITHETESEDGETDKDTIVLSKSSDSLGRRSSRGVPGSGHAAQRPKLETVLSSGSNVLAKQRLDMPGNHTDERVEKLPRETEEERSEMTAALETKEPAMPLEHATGASGETPPTRELREEALLPSDTSRSVTPTPARFAATASAVAA